MSSITEILIRREGEPGADAGVLFDGHICGPDEAEADARERCADDPAIERIVYEFASAGGKSRVLYTYVNPYPVARETATFSGNPLLRRLRAVFSSEHDPLV
jgi:hypothetical protein